MITRIRLTRAQKVKVFNDAKGLCHICKMKIHAERDEKWDVEHVVPLWLGGPDDLKNLAPAHKACHREKTDGEASVRAKTDRQRANHLGIPKPGPKLPAGRNSDKTKTILKGVQPRRSGAQKHADLMEKLYPWGIPE